MMHHATDTMIATPFHQAPHIGGFRAPFEAMKNHHNALWLIPGIKPIEVNEVAIGKLYTLASQRHAWALQYGWQDRLHVAIFRPLGSG